MALPNTLITIVNDKPKPICKLRMELPGCLTRVINKAPEKEPRRRCADGKAMAAALRRCGERAGYLRS